MKGCGSIYASKVSTPDALATDGEKHGLKVLGVDGRNDLALLTSAKSFSKVAIFRDGRGVRTGEDIIVTGFPLQGLLTSDINVTNGIVSALAGPGDDRRIIQITAPIQPGNSGGPVLDASGHVVGVVVARLEGNQMMRELEVLKKQLFSKL